MSDRDSDGARAQTSVPNVAPPQRAQIYVMRADGAEVRRLTQGELTAAGASWSPDGKALAIFEATVPHTLFLSRSFESPHAESQIAHVDVATGERTALTRGPGRKLTSQWLPDGRIAYLRSDTEERPRFPGGGRRRPDYWSERIQFTDGSDGPPGVASPSRLEIDPAVA